MQRIAVIGAGTMGHGIAQVCAMAGYDVVITDVSQDAVAVGLAKARANLDKGVARGKVSDAVRDLAARILGERLPHEKLAAIEAAPDRFAADAWRDQTTVTLTGPGLAVELRPEAESEAGALSYGAGPDAAAGAAAAGVETVTADQCQYGLEVLFGKYRGQPVKRPAGFMSNAPVLRTKSVAIAAGSAMTSQASS